MKTEKPVASSQPEKLVRRSLADIRKYAKSDEAKATAERLKASGPYASETDLEDIPELTGEDLARMRPVKQTVTVRLDTEVVDWLKASGSGYQTRMNAILRAVMLRAKSR